jgi:DNA polymerase III epsilon subunit family exonuclease
LTESEQNSAGPNGYDALRTRAFEYISDHNGRVTEDDLIRFMFGAATKPALWRTLLVTVLGNDHRFIQVGNQTWALAGSDQTTSTDVVSFVAIDVETTGLRPRQHRVIEIGMARYTNGRCTERYSTLINPERRVPDYVRKLTGLTDSDLIPAPRFGQVAGEIAAFMGDLPLLGHNVGFDAAFLNAEFERAKLPAIKNQTIDTVPMAMRVLGRTMRPSLDRVATALGLQPRKYHRALADAELSAAVALRLLGMAAESGTTIEALIRSTRAAKPLPAGHGQSAGELLDRRHLDDLPRRPGVYLMIDANDRVLYVGKAKSLRDRVGSYYSQPLGYTRKMDGLVESIARIEHEETGSELVALLLESQLIRRHQPPYNQVLRNSESYPYIRIDPANPWPNLRIAKQRRPDGARYFGPYRSQRTVKDAIELLNRRFHLRTCSRGFKTPASYGNPCLELDLHRCDGPCVGRAIADEYRAGVNAVLGLLDLDRDDVLLDLEAELEEASEALRFEQAQRIRRELDVLTRLREEQEALASFALQEPCLIVQPAPHGDGAQILMIIEGRWWALVVVDSSTETAAAERLDSAWRRYVERGIEPIDHSGVDEANIITRWRKMDESQHFVVRIPDIAQPDWLSLVREAGSRLIAAAMPDQPTGDSAPETLVVASDDDGFGIGLT